jgi:carboxynorspermidine decarboxylase
MNAGIGWRRTGTIAAGGTACRRAASLARIARAVETPAFVIDERVIVDAAHRGSQLARLCGFRLLSALKPLPDARVLSLMTPWLDGFSASSMSEARLARSVLGESGSVHATSPGIRERDIDELAHLCDRVALNSLSRLRRLGPRLRRPGQLGLGINLQLSPVDDERDAPCRRHAKPGVPLDALLARLARDPGLLDGVRGLLVHSHSDSPDFTPLLRSVRHLEDALGDRLDRLDWINLGGGDLLEPGADTFALRQAVSRLRDGHGLTVFLEPGAALVRKAGLLVAEVIDLFGSQGKRVAVLDTTVNHFPGAFDYPFEPDVPGHGGAEHEYLLAGCSGLAGDVLGEYGFEEPLRIGARVVLPDLAAHPFAKAHMFNGINLPAVYSVGEDGTPVLRRRLHDQDFLSRFGASCDAAG